MTVRLHHYHGCNMWESREALPRSAIDNRARLLDLAGDLFAEQGYVQVSVRDPRESTRTHNRCDLLELPEQG